MMNIKKHFIFILLLSYFNSKCSFFDPKNYAHEHELIETYIIDIDSLKTLLHITSIKIENINSLNDLNNILQEQWLQLSKERWEMDITSLNEADKVTLINTLSNSRLFTSINTNIETPSIILILGSTLFAIEERISYLKNLLKKNTIKDHHIVFLVGERTLRTDEIERLKTFYHNESVTTEIEMGNILASYYQNDFKDINITVFGGKKDPLNPKQRATTASTFNDFYTSYSKEINNKKMYAISNGCYISYQQSVIDLILNEQQITKNVLVLGDTVLADKEKISIYLDLIAKIIYNIKHMLKPMY